MKQVYVLRHADKNKETNQLTNDGRKRAKALQENIGPFDLVITSNRDRTKETALLLTEQSPLIDSRTGFFYFSSQQEKEIRTIAKDHVHNYAGALFSDKKFQDLAIALGKNLISVIQEALTKLPENGKALIVSQDGVMVAAEKLLTKKSFDELEKTFLPLQGFIVDENLKYTELR